MSKVLTGIPATRHAANVLTRSHSGPTWRGQAAPLQPRTPSAHYARGAFAGASRGWAALSPDNQAQYKTLAAASGGRYRSGYALFVANSITNAAGGVIGPPSSYVEGGAITFANLTIDDFGDLTCVVNTSSGSTDAVRAYFLCNASNTRYTFSKNKARQLPFTLTPGQTTFLNSFWPLNYGVFPPYSQRIIAWFQAVSELSGFTGPMAQFTFLMPDNPF